ncbi:hypothetical protein [Xylanibacter brevis]|uniref:hypothetical protein n=1 Tax=Xylanibacter brevis TaxID=83231 RepID=UPI0004878A7A|nr:hypothetical protein [Xylanibacter brevis]
MRELLLSLLITSISLYVCASELEINSIEQLRGQVDNTSIVLEVHQDTIYKTTDGRICLSDGVKVLVEGLEQVHAGQIISGILKGTKKSADGYPLFIIDAAKSNYEIIGTEIPFFVIDLDAYEKNLSQQEPAGSNDDDPLPQDDIEGLPTAEGIRAFRDLPIGTEARLKFQRDTVLFIGGEDIYIRGDAPICFHATGLDLKVGNILRGTVIGIRGEQNGIPTLLASKNTSSLYFVCQDVDPFIERFYKEHPLNFNDLEINETSGDVVTVEDVVIDSLEDNNGIRMLYACKNTLRLPITDLYGLNLGAIRIPAHCNSMEAILYTDEKQPKLCLMNNLQSIITPLNITELSTNLPNKTKGIFDLQGRRLSRIPEKGMYIKDGKKYVK